MSSHKVCFVARTAYALFNPAVATLPGATHGGAEVDLYLLALELAKDSKYEVSFIVGDFGQPEKEMHENIAVYSCFEYSVPKNPKNPEPRTQRSLNFLQKLPLIKNIWAHFVFGQKINRLKSLRRLAMLFKSINADIYVQEAAGPLTGVCCFLAKVFNKKFIYRTAHDMDCDLSYIKEQSKKGLADGFLYEWGLTHADALITQNIHNQESLKKNHNLQSVVIKNAYPIPTTIPKKDGTILWVARSVEWKRPELFIKLAQEFPDTNFVMICPKANEESVDYNELENEALKTQNLELIKYVPFNEIDVYFQKASVLVNTSKFEGYPNTFVQAAKNWTPIISLNVNPDNFLIESGCGFDCKNNFDLLTEYTKKLIDNKELYEQMSSNAHAYAEKEHDLSLITEEYKQVFERCIQK